MKHNSFPKPSPSHNFDLSSYDTLIRETKQNIKRLKQELQSEQNTLLNSTHPHITSPTTIFDLPPSTTHTKSITLTEPNEHITTRKQLQSLTSENTELKLKLSTSLQQLQEVLTIVHEIKTQKNQIEYALHTLHSEYKNNYMKIKTTIEQLETQCTMNDAYMKLQHENETLKRELNTIMNENMQMKYALYNSNSNNINEVSQYNNNNNNLNDGSYTLHNLKKTNETLLAKNVSLENDLNETKDNYMQLNTLYNEVLSENENALNKVTYLFEEINNMKIEMDKLSQGYNADSNCCNDNNMNNERLCVEMQNISERNGELIEENKYLNNTVKEMISNNNELNKAIEQLTTRLHEVNVANTELATQNEMLHKQIELLQQQQQLQQHEILTSIKP